MDINLTLFGETITFAIFVWFCMKFIWPPIMNALEARRTQIADGLAAAERGKHELDLASKRSVEYLHDAKVKASEVIAQAEKRAAQIIDEAKNSARAEGDRLLVAARAEMEQDVVRAQENLRDHVGKLVVAGVEKILRREIDAKVHADLLEEIKSEL